ncbi:hypothetical protein [Entomobacter blattae]|uniref:Uncharacterized protein n=1 Tax=Entomobacter blattae TaxID=2762277 RepID=A0A7H1NRZ3_9PROT|nr:hypothetical protein [Entomobacter blattae]QNT78553.1 hypothetical protein JGUZn3_13270 [Entomobacter blattae]
MNARKAFIRKETLAVIIILTIAIVSAIGVWMMALPTLQPLSFPQVVTAEIQIGPERTSRVLSPEETEHLQEWLNHNTQGWRPVVHKETPSSGDAIIVVNNHHLSPQKGQNISGKDEDEHRFSLRVWDGINMGDWNRTIILERGEGEPVKKKKFSQKEFAFIRLLLDGYHYKRSLYP